MKYYNIMLKITNIKDIDDIILNYKSQLEHYDRHIVNMSLIKQIDYGIYQQSDNKIIRVMRDIIFHETNGDYIFHSSDYCTKCGLNLSKYKLTKCNCTDYKYNKKESNKKSKLISDLNNWFAEFKLYNQDCTLNCKEPNFYEYAKWAILC